MSEVLLAAAGLAAPLAVVGGAYAYQTLTPTGRHRAVVMPLQAAPFAQPQEGTRWLVCHELACGHMTTRHLPAPDDAWTCTGCNTIKKGIEQ
ncbi:hypothetical protein [Streptomyces sp. NPDC096153]|uniref:hypothetical protein n=1 Tax=Streptomyces sp. NPDC096153 TaxID=3155548 RepID=UPI00332AD04F